MTNQDQETVDTAKNNQTPVGSKAKPNNVRMFLTGVAVVIVLSAGVGMVVGFKATRRLSDDAVTLRFAKVFGVSVAKVNNLPISYHDYISELNVLRKVYAGAPQGVAAPTEEKMSDDVLGNLIINTIIAGEAKKYNVSLSQKDIEESTAYKGILAQFNNDTTAAGKQIMEKYGLEFNDYIDKAIKPVLIEQRLREEFEKSSDEAGKPYSEEQVRASHILFKVDNFDDAKSVSKVKKQAEEVLARVKKGEDFAKLASEFGSDGTMTKGGDLGWFGPGQMVKEFEDAVWALKAGELDQNLVQTQFGFHIVKVTERRNGRNYSKYMADIIRKSKVDVLLPIHNPFTDIKSQLDAQAGAAAEANSTK